MAAMGPADSETPSESNQHVENANAHLVAADQYLSIDNSADTISVKRAYAHSMAAIGHLLAAVITGDEDE